MPKSWTAPVPTNFPNATCKIFSLRLSPGYRVLISTTEDGLTFTRIALLGIPSPRPSTLQYPHAIEHDRHLLIAFSRNKATIEILKVPLDQIESLRKGSKP
jgi:hypothetical protein